LLKHHCQQPFIIFPMLKHHVQHFWFLQSWNTIAQQFFIYSTCFIFRYCRNTSLSPSSVNKLL
jgi:hypothetical protein